MADVKRLDDAALDGAAAANSEDDTPSYMDKRLNFLHTFAEPEQVAEWEKEFYDAGLNPRKHSDIDVWFEDLRLKHAPKLLGREACVQVVTLLQVLPRELPNFGSQHRCSTNCERCDI